LLSDSPLGLGVATPPKQANARSLRVKKGNHQAGC
jgi:hypothetical protein